MLKKKKNYWVEKKNVNLSVIISRIQTMWWWYAGGQLWRHSVCLKMTIKAADRTNKAWKKWVVHPVFWIKGKPSGPHFLAPFAQK